MTQLSATPKTVIVAVDDRHTRERFSAALREAGHHAIEVRTQEELLSSIKSPSPVADLLILDLRLVGPRAEAARAAVERGSRTSVVVLSGSVKDAANVRELAGIGINSYVNEYCADQHILPSLAPRLFPDSFNRRTSTRVTLDLPVAFRFADTIATAPTLNLSKGGLAVRTMTPVDAGTKVHVRFRLPGSRRDIDANSRVAWSDHRAGMGLQFEEVGTTDQSSIDEFVDRDAIADRARQEPG